MAENLDIWVTYWGNSEWQDEVTLAKNGNTPCPDALTGYWDTKVCCTQYWKTLWKQRTPYLEYN